MFIHVNGRITQVSEGSRIKFRTSISKQILDELRIKAMIYNMHVNHFFEIGIKNLLDIGTINYDKKFRPKDRVQFKSTYDKYLLQNLREFAQKNNVFINDCMEYGIKLINFNDFSSRAKD